MSASGGSGSSETFPIVNVSLGQFAAGSLGLLAGEFFGGIAQAVETTFSALIINPIQGAASFASGGLRGFFEALSGSVGGAFLTGEIFAESSGALGFVVGLAIVATTAYLGIVAFQEARS
jgi:hypothetical protein